MEETPNTQTPEEETPETPETPASPETPTEGAGLEGQPVETTPSGNEPSPEKRIKELERDYSASSTEAKRLAAENKLLKTQLEGNTSGVPLSDEEAVKVVPDWDMLSPAEQYLAREQVMLKRQLARLGISVAQTTKETSFNNKLDELAKDSRFSDIVKSKEEFKEFCEGQEPTEKLAKAFLFDKAEEIGAKKEAEKLSRPGLEKKSGGTGKVPVAGLSDAEKEHIRKNDPQRYEKLIKAGKV